MKKLLALFALLTCFIGAQAVTIIDGEVNFKDYPDGPCTLTSWGGGERLSFANGYLHYYGESAMENAWDCQFFPISGMTINPGVIYTVEFKIKGSAASPIFNMKVGGVDRYNLCYLAGGDQWETFTFQYEATSSDGGVMIQCGNYVGSWDMEYMKVYHEEHYEIYYTTSDGEIVEPLASANFGASILSNTYKDGKGVIEFNDHVTQIDENAFKGCNTLTTITLPEGVRTVGTSAFQDCSLLESITFPSSVISIGTSAFSGCDNLVFAKLLGPVVPKTSETFTYSGANVGGIFFLVPEIAVNSYKKNFWSPTYSSTLAGDELQALKETFQTEISNKVESESRLSSSEKSKIESWMTTMMNATDIEATLNARAQACLVITGNIGTHLVQHLRADPTNTTVGYAQDCWEDTETGKMFAEKVCFTELEPAKTITYVKLVQSPIIETSGTADNVTFETYESRTYEDSQFNWGFEMKYNVTRGKYDVKPGNFTVKFIVHGTDVNNARFKWYRNDTREKEYGSNTLDISVNGKSVFTRNDWHESGFTCFPLNNLKTNDIVTVKIDGPNNVFWVGEVVVAGCLEYTSSNGGKDIHKDITAIKDPENPENYYATFYSNECAYKVPDNAKSYTGREEAGVLRITEISNIIPKGAPVILKLNPENVTENQYQFTLIPSSSDITYDRTNGLIGNGESTLTAEANTYCLAVKDNVLGYYPFSGTIAANSAYLKFDKATGVGVYRLTEIDNNLVFHPQSKPTMEQYGYAQNCWENTKTGKFYTDYSCKEELHPGKVLIYDKLLQNPIISNQNFDTYENGEFDGCKFNWGLYMKYNTSFADPGPTRELHTAQFIVYGTDVANARLKWYRNVSEHEEYGTYNLDISVNGESVYALENSCKSGLFCIPLPNLKTCDIVTFTIDAPINEVTWIDDVIMTACLEYTSSNGGRDIHKDITANKDPKNPENYYATFYSNECAYEVPDNAMAYIGMVNGDVLKMKDIGSIIHKGEAVILKATGNSVVLIPSANKEEASSQNELIGTDKAMTLGENDYALSLGQNGVGFYLWEGNDIDANKAYLHLDEQTLSKALTFDFSGEGITGIKPTVQPYNRTTETYNLNGIRVDNNYKGIVIKNGKKYYQR